MEEWILDDLLECSVCLERLDTSSKVLPCQHTFCKKCLEEISRTHNELRCPECRILVETAIDDLPPNVLLMRILEGIRNVNPDHPVNKSTQSHKPSEQHTKRNSRSPQIEKPTAKSTSLPCAKAIYDYFSNEPGDLSFKKGDIVFLRKKVDLNWYKGDINGRVGVFPANYVQVLEPLPSQVPQCKALYDFKMANDDEEGCLAFSKGEIITVIRRVDENWAEGKLNNKIGIFPIAFVELNSVSRALMKLSIEAQPGPSRVAPPTPTTKEDPVHIPAVTAATSTSHHTNAFKTAVAASLPTSDSSSTSLTSPSSTSNTTTPTTSTSSHTSPSSPSHSIPLSPTFGPVKRHSFGSTLPNGAKNTAKRHSAEILSNQEASNEPLSLPLDVTSSQGHLPLERTGSQRMKRNAESIPPIPGPQVQHSSLQLPALYVALYPYKPGNSDELELKRGAIYTVTERCQDGWFKGQHFRSQKSGVFPGNYVAPAKSLPALQAQVRGLCRTKPTGAHSTPRNGTPPLEPRNPISYVKPLPVPALKESRVAPPPVVLPPTALPNASELASSTAIVAPPNVSVPSVSNKSADKAKEKKDKGGGLMRRLASMKKSKSPPPPTPYSMDNPVFEDSSVTFCPPVHVRSGSCPNQLISNSSSDNRLFSPTSSHRCKVKERPSISRISPRVSSDSKGVQHRKSSSMDTPGCEVSDLTLSSSSRNLLDDHKGPACSSTTPFLNVIDIAKSSQSKVVLTHEAMNDGPSAKPEIMRRSFLQHEELFNQVVARLQSRDSSNEPSKSSKRLMMSPEPTHNQDGKSKNLPMPRERFRCIVPYPPNSEYELELQLGDVIYVHKKREDGWYKGTQQRTGRTGLFPASFVQSF